ncbi:hypothetical protein MA03_06415 [Infirmifilum uzonense]|uniref:4Fe-4S ferredoxin-type domain-containing protein n=1 Tax=Infirmifilum uzonense TaxID=1550241 RepID=A0A0F7CL82_9CREN|nr:hypothetical protein [Infirmifilum uzonense]AKG38956.1 hypothetical protein MA03_06415 [Infirmifilum uzonense]
MSRPIYFAGLSLTSPRGVSSEDVVLYNIPEFATAYKEKFGVFFLPTVTDSELSFERNKTRILVHYFSSWKDYVIVTRPFSFSVEEVEAIARKIREESKVIASIAASRLSSLTRLSSRFMGIVDGFEIDLGLTSLLIGEHRSFESYAIDVIEEFVSVSKRPVFVKVSPSVQLSSEFLENLRQTGIAGMVFTPHIVYSIGREFFRVHSPYLSKLYALIWAKLIASTDIPTAYISDIPEHLLGEVSVEKTFDILLFDTALLSTLVDMPGVVELDKEMPIRWRYIPDPLRPAIDVVREPQCLNVCPYRAFSKEKNLHDSPSGLAVADEKCNVCGLCLSSCKDVKLMATLTPE